MDKISDLKHIVIKTLDSNKAQNIVSINLKDKSSMADYMIIASGTSSRHIQSLSEQVLEKLKDNKDMNEAFGQNVINSYIKLRSSEINEFNQKENFDKTKAITRWERNNTLDC